MVKESGKKCSTCGNNGHNTRSCNSKKDKEICVKLFGFKIYVPENNNNNNESLSNIRKVKSTPNMSSCNNNQDCNNNNNNNNLDLGYFSDGHLETKKRGLPWSENEHRLFLSGLENLGKGNWKAISIEYVRSKTPTQVASHAQKYFNRLNGPAKIHRRASLFDMTLNEPEIINTPLLESHDHMNIEIPHQTDDLPDLNMNTNGDTEEQSKDPPKDAASSMIAPPDLHYTPYYDITEEEGNNSPKASATPLTVPSVLPYGPYYGVPNFSQMPYMPMMGMTGNGQIFAGLESFPTMTSIPMMYMQNPGYFFLPDGSGSEALSTPLYTHGSLSTMARP